MIYSRSRSGSYNHYPAYHLMILILIVIITIPGVIASFAVGNNRMSSGKAVMLDVSVNERQQSSTALSLSKDIEVMPSLIVFDLDNTLWTPELYQLRKIARNKQFPVARKDVNIFPAVWDVIQDIKKDESGVFSNTKFAVASRTKSVEWAHDLLKQFELDDFFSYVQIFPGNKKEHFQNLKADSGIAYEDMLFFDDARDGRYGNCVPVSNLGVLSCHCPNGIYEQNIWDNALLKYSEWRKTKEKNTIIEWDGSITTKTVDSNKRYRGVVKMVNSEKRFGFIRHTDSNMSDTFVHFSALTNTDYVEVGDEVTFMIKHDDRKGKDAAASVEVDLPEAMDTVQLRAFSMNLPFAALLANGYKTLETRNGTMFTPYPEGTKMLLQVGQRIYPDGDRHIEVMKSGGLSDSEIENLKSLPKGFTKGQAVAIVEIGKTFETSLEQRCDPDFQRSVGAFGRDSGMRATEIRRVQYLNKGFKVSGKGGVFKVNINRDLIPDGWLDDE